MVSHAQQAPVAASAVVAVAVDEARPHTKLQIRLADGSRCVVSFHRTSITHRRLVGKFNNDQPVADVRRFIDAFGRA